MFIALKQVLCLCLVQGDSQVARDKKMSKKFLNPVAAGFPGVLPVLRMHAGMSMATISHLSMST